LARRTGIQASTLSNYRKGKDMKASHLVEICLELGVSADELLGLPNVRDDELHALIDQLDQERRDALKGVVRLLVQM